MLSFARGSTPDYGNREVKGYMGGNAGAKACILRFRRNRQIRFVNREVKVRSDTAGFRIIV